MYIWNFSFATTKLVLKIISSLWKILSRKWNLTLLINLIEKAYQITICRRLIWFYNCLAKRGIGNEKVKLYSLEIFLPISFYKHSCRFNFVLVPVFIKPYRTLIAISSPFSSAKILTAERKNSFQSKRIYVYIYIYISIGITYPFSIARNILFPANCPPLSFSAWPVRGSFSTIFHSFITMGIDKPGKYYSTPSVSFALRVIVSPSCLLSE